MWKFNIKQIDKTAQEFLQMLIDKNYKKVAFYGKMGSGKTTFIKALTKQLNVIDEVVSPTFAIINEYKTKKGENIYHFDFYRLKAMEEALQIGTEEYLYSDNWIFIEWPQIIEDILPEDFLKAKLEIIDETTRALSVIE